jgi:hypothetical protein
MLEQKESLINMYYELTLNLLNSFVQGKQDDIAGLLDSREKCISSINKLDVQAGQIMINEKIQTRISELIEIEKDIHKHMELSLKRLASQVQLVQNEQYLSKQYEDPLPVSKGIFYDRSK